EYEARLTDPAQAAGFIAQTGADLLAVCVGNVHGRYPGAPRLDFERLAASRRAGAGPLGLHGASGPPRGEGREAVRGGGREAYVAALRTHLSAASAPDVLDLMSDAVAAMQEVVAGKLRLFGSSGRV